MRTEILNHRLGSRTSRTDFTLTAGQAMLVATLIGLGVSLLLATVQVALFSTILLFLAVLLAGLILCDSTVRRLTDPKLHVLKTFWVIKVGLTLVLLYLGWIPELDPGASPSWGYDPQRFFQLAYDLVENGWKPTGGMNYQGILYYYGTIFYVFGHNPVIPALINAFVTLLGTLFLIRIAYEFKPERSARDWTIAYLLLIPEFLWFDVMTSRETLLAVLILVSSLAVGRYLVASGKASLFLYTFALSGICLGGILAIRTSMVIPVVGAIVLMTLFLRSGRRYGPIMKVVLLSLGIGVLVAAPMIGKILDSSEFDYVSQLKNLQSYEENIASKLEGWSENSIGILLVPNNTVQALVFLPPRMVLYLAAPLPKLGVSVSDLIAGSWGAWQHLMTLSTSMLYLLVLPYTLASFSQAWKLRKQRPSLFVLHIAFWMIFIAIAGGNIIIHERYRVMMTLLFFACAWLGYTNCSRRQVRRFALPWFAFLGVGVVFYFVYKSL